MVPTKISMLQASHDVLSAGNVTANSIKTMLRNNIIAVFYSVYCCVKYNFSPGTY